MSAYKFSYASSAGLQLRVIEELVDTDGGQPCVLARQAALYHAFGDVVGAHRAATKAQQAASQPDHEFDTWVADLAAEVDAFRQKTRLSTRLQEPSVLSNPGLFWRTRRPSSQSAP